MSIVHFTSNLGLLGYAIASVLYLLAAQKTRPTTRTGNAAFGLFVVATIAVSVGLGAVARTASLTETAGLLLTSAIGWLAIGGHLQFGMRLIGAFVAPLATLILLIQAFVAPLKGAPPASAEAGAALVSVHVAMAILGEAFAIIACAVSVVYLWQQNLLKKKLLDQLGQNVPAIDRLAFLLRVSLWSGFIFITLSLVTGALYTQMYEAPASLKLKAKVVWAACVWAWYLATLLAGSVFARPSRRIAQMSLAGFVLIAITYFGMGFFGPLGGG